MTTVANPQQAAPQQGTVVTIRDRLKSPALIAEIGKAMPTHCKPERMARVALTALTRTPLLAQCEEASFFQCLLSLSQWGLEPDGRRAHLIPFRNNKRNVIECQLIIDYKGYVELAYRSGVVKNIHADVVRDGDIFAYNLGSIVRHVPWFLRRDADKPKEAGEVFAVYCLAELAGGTVKTEVLSKSDIDGIRKRSKAANNGPWVTDWCEMAKKTAFRRLSKWIPLSADILDAMDADADTVVAHPTSVTETPVGRIESLESLTQRISGPTNGNGANGHSANPEDDDKNFNAEGEYTGPTEAEAAQTSPDDNADLEAGAAYDDLQQALEQAPDLTTINAIETAALDAKRVPEAKVKMLAETARGRVRNSRGGKKESQRPLAGTT